MGKSVQIINGKKLLIINGWTTIMRHQLKISALVISVATASSKLITFSITSVSDESAYFTMVCTEHGAALLEGDGEEALLDGDGEVELLEVDGEEVELVERDAEGEPLEACWLCSDTGRSRDNLCTATISSVNGLILYSDVFSFLFLFL